MSARPLIKRQILRGLRAGGMFPVLANLRSRNSRLLILCYHGLAVLDEQEWQGLLYITPGQFTARLTALRDWGANVLPLDEGLRRMYAGTLPARAVAITFDDGFVDFQLAAEDLKRFQFPATVYLTTHYAAHRLPIFNLALNYVLWKSGRNREAFPEFGIAPSEIESYEGRQKLVSAFVRWCDDRQLSTPERHQVLAQAAEHLGVDLTPLMQTRALQIMKPEEVAALPGELIAVELHTHRHRTPHDRTLFLREISDNAASIREMTGRAATHFCYPSGVTSPEFLPWLREAGVKSATTCVPRLASKHSDSLMMPRILDDSTMSTLDFETWFYGIR